LREQYGDDIITELDYRQPENFLKLISKDSDVRDQFAKLKMVADAQAKTIRDLERENEGLKKQLRRLAPQA
jgi:archaellum component FlaC